LFITDYEFGINILFSKFIPIRFEKKLIMILIDGKKVSAAIQDKISLEIQKRKRESKPIPHLTAVLVGNDGGSETYVASKMKTCESVGMKSSLHRFTNDVTEEELLNLISKLNEDDDITGILIQLPLPKHINSNKIIFSVSPAKDVDGFHPLNTGRMIKGLACHIPATPNGILLLLEYYKIETAGKNCVVIGRSDIVGKPISILMSRSAYPGNCTVTICHSYSKDIKSICQQADIIIAAIGKPDFVTKDFIKEGAVVIDVGTTRTKDDTKKSGYSIKGDVKFDEVAEKCSYITPVPGGVGPMTIASLMMNTLQSTEIDFK
jgi:methylenetetrahydrofolate dehydrogenase (NADP+)/methenyltetrahydrofolate cyclohydrolase